MANPKWTVSVIFQNSDPNDILFFNSLREDIELQEKRNPGVIKYFILRQDEKKKEAIAFTINNQGKLEDIVGTYPIKDFYKNLTVPKHTWSEFFKLASVNDTKHFVMTHGHGAGFGFSTSLKTDTDNKGNKPFNLLRILLSHSSLSAESFDYINKDIKESFTAKFNIETPNFSHDDTDGYFGIVPVGIFREAIEEAYKDKVISFLYFGNCFMQTIENGFLFKNKVKYMAATEGYYEPTGTDYQRVFQIMATETEESKLYKKIALAICEGIPDKTNDSKMKVICGQEELERIKNGFSFSVNDLSKYDGLKNAISAFGNSLIENSKYPKVKEGINITREDPRICKDVWEDQKLGITDLLRFCKNLSLDKMYLEVSPTSVYDCMAAINELLKVIVVARYFPFKAFEPIQNGATSVYPEGASIFFPRRKPDRQEEEDDVEQYLNLYMNTLYRSNKFNHPFLDKNQWQAFVLKYYDRLL